ncbi:MAG: MFS transporter [bacterium]
MTQGIAVGATVGTFTLFVQPLEQAFSAPRSQVSLGNSLLVLALSLAGPFVGGLFDRGWARRVMLFGGLLLGSALLLASNATSLWGLGLAALLAGCAIPMIGPLAGISLVARIFDQDRGRAMGVVSMGPPLGSGLLAAGMGWILPVWGWRGGYLLMAAITFGLVLPLVWLVIPSRPPDPAPHESAAAAGDAPPSGSRPPDLGGIARMPVFWLTAAVFALMAGIATGWMSQIAPFLVESGLAEPEVAGLLALQFWLGIPGALLFGALADRVRLVTLYLGILVFQGLAYLVYASEIPPAGISLLVVSFGFVGGGIIPLFSLLLGSRVGADALGRAMGLANLLLLPCTIGSITIASLTHDWSGRYSEALVLFAGGIGLAFVCLLLSEREARRQRTRESRSRVVEGA